MDARYYDSPTKASAYAFWTLHDAWRRNLSEYLPKINTAPESVKENGVQNKNTEDSDITETTYKSVIASEEDTISGESDSDYNDRKNVWSDIDDELYIANLIKLRTSNEVSRVIRDTSLSSVSDFKEVVNSVKLDKYEMWELEPTDLTDCDCLGPPPEFLLPPPPRPPFLQAEYYCADDPIPDLETCNTEPVSI